MYLISGLIEQLETYLSAEQIQLVEDAFVFAKDAHEGQMRSSGEPYITHPVAVAKILSEINLDHQTIMAALMHDVIEDTAVTQELMTDKFGESVADLVEGVSKLTKIKFSTRAEAQAENFRKMMMAMVRDIRVIMIKLADRLHNMRTLGHLRADKRRRIAHETLDIYAPIANRLGIYNIREEMQVLGFAALHPMRHEILEAAVKKARGNRKEIINTIQQGIEKQLQETNIKFEVFGASAKPASFSNERPNSANKIKLPKNKMTPDTLCRMDAIAVIGKLKVVRSKLTGRSLDIVMSLGSSSYR